MSTKHTPEPWTCESNCDWSVYGGDNSVAFDDGSAGGEYSPSCTIETRDRIMACVNALLGIADPAGAIEGARKALEAAEQRDEENQPFTDLECFCDDPETSAEYRHEYFRRRNQREALASLTPAKEQKAI